MNARLLPAVCLILAGGWLEAAPAEPELRGAIQAHDPSSVVRCGDLHWFFSTGPGVKSHCSRDLVEWKPGPPVVAGLPAWAREAVPKARPYFWAPDVIKVGGRFLLYYSVSTFGSQVSAIGLAVSDTLEPRDGRVAWRDEGIVVRSRQGDDFNAIDPSAFLDEDGRLWLAFGSFWSGIKLVELDPRSGRRRAPEVAPVALAMAKEIEAPYLCRRGDFYYLFVNWGLCCRGLQSTYEIRVGRSRKVTGPYLDRAGTDLQAGGGTLVLGSDGRRIGPGHASRVATPRGERLACHFYDAENRGRATLALVPLEWTADGWPVCRKEAAPAPGR